ncbi:MAG: UDP-galactopyranose mutase [Lachnospiraceae bacterium]|nr:UDP-galactopyranose mutase [Lachnospiraceae bacterium]
MKYDFLIVGAGLYAAVFAHEAVKAGKKVLVIERRDHIAGNAYSEETEGIQVHKYGPHIFHTSDPEVWEFVNRFAEFNRFTNCPIARYGDEQYCLPFNMHTFHAMWGVKTPAEAKARIEEQKREAGIGEPKNLEEQAISLVGRDIYEKLVKGYTEKQWGRPCTELPAFIIRRLPVRFTYDNNYFNDRWQGIPIGGYTAMAEKMFEGAEILLGTEYFADRAHYDSVADMQIFTGPIDRYFDECYGTLEYRSLRFETEVRPESNHQGVALVNYTEKSIPYTRIIEHKFFDPDRQAELPSTVITREYPAEWKPGDEPYYPINNERNNSLYEKYRALAETKKGLRFGGRLGTYRYLDMDKVIAQALKDVRECL